MRTILLASLGLLAFPLAAAAQIPDDMGLCTAPLDPTGTCVQPGDIGDTCSET